MKCYYFKLFLKFYYPKKYLFHFMNTFTPLCKNCLINLILKRQNRLINYLMKCSNLKRHFLRLNIPNYKNFQKKVYLVYCPNYKVQIHITQKLN